MTVATHGTEVPAQEPPRVERDKLRKVRRRDYTIRFAFGAAVSVVSAVLGVTVGYKFAGLFLGFPAILPATLTLLERKEGPAQATSDVRGATLGAIGMLGFALVVLVLLEHTPPWALPVGLATWVVVSIGIYMLLRGLVHLLGERQFLPEIPAVEAEAAMNALRERQLTIGLAESCTGGLVGALLTNVPGASDLVRGVMVTYTDDMKAGVLHVPKELIDERTSVSAAVAREMALNAKQQLGADVGLAVTGLLGTARDGPDGGLTYIALAMPDNRVLLRQYTDNHGPGRNRERDVRMALKLIVDGVSAER